MSRYGDPVGIPVSTEDDRFRDTQWEKLKQLLKEIEADDEEPIRKRQLATGVPQFGLVHSITADNVNTATAPTRQP